MKHMGERRSALFRGRHFRDEIIVLCLRWYLRYPLSYRDLEEMMAERGLAIDHSTIARWVLRYAPVLNERIRSEMRQPNRSWRCDETYIRVAGQWTYLIGPSTQPATPLILLFPSRSIRPTNVQKASLWSRSSVGRSLDHRCLAEGSRIRCIGKFSTVTLRRLQSANDTRVKESVDNCCERLKSGAGGTVHILHRWSITSQTDVRVSFVTNIWGTPSQPR